MIGGHGYRHQAGGSRQLKLAAKRTAAALVAASLVFTGCASTETALYRAGRLMGPDSGRNRTIEARAAALHRERVVVRVRGHAPMAGVLVALDDSSLSLAERDHIWRIPLRDIVAVERSNSQSTASKVAIITGIGLAGFAILWLVMASRD